MSNTFMENLIGATNFTNTENGAVTHKSTRSMVLDLFAMGAAYRSRSDEDCILLFKNAYEENAELALKCLFYIADCRGGQGERRFFRVCFRWLAQNHTAAARRNLQYIAEYRRWDDVIYSCVDTPLEAEMLDFIKKQLALDVECKTPSLLAKWLPSENASAAVTRRTGNLIRESLGWTHKQYRKTLSILRERINVLERLMSAGRWDEIEFDKIPSKAGLVYKNAFARRDMIAKKYETFAKDKETKVNAGTLYPYEVVAKAAAYRGYGYRMESLSATDRAMIEKYWENLPDYLNGDASSMMAVVDTSGSMVRSDAAAPINVAISLGMYFGERSRGAFKDHYISFASRPQLIKIEGTDFCDKVQRIYRTNLCDNTNIEATLELVRQIALNPNTKREDVPKTLVIISDMEFDSAAGSWRNPSSFNRNNAETLLEGIARKWEADGLEMPHLIFWNVDARQNNIPMIGQGRISYVSGMSPSIFKSIITGKTGYDLMLEAIMSERYAVIH